MLSDGGRATARSTDKKNIAEDGGHDYSNEPRRKLKKTTLRHLS